MGGHPWDTGLGGVGSAAGKALPVPSAGVKGCLGPGVTASQPGQATWGRASLQHQRYHSNGSSHRPPLPGLPAPGTEMDSHPHQLPRRLP